MACNEKRLIFCKSLLPKKIPLRHWYAKQPRKVPESWDEMAPSWLPGSSFVQRTRFQRWLRDIPSQSKPDFGGNRLVYLTKMHQVHPCLHLADEHARLDI